MLDRAEALAIGEPDIARRDIVLAIDESLAADAWRIPDRRAGRKFGIGRDLRQELSFEPAMQRSVRTQRATLPDRGCEIEVAGCGSDHRHALRQSRRRQEHRARLVPDRLS